jgi:hypothetical protein
MVQEARRKLLRLKTIFAVGRVAIANCQGAFVTPDVYDVGKTFWV